MQLKDIDKQTWMYILLVLGLLVVLTSYLTLPDGEYCTLDYGDGHTLTAPKSYCRKLDESRHKLQEVTLNITSGEFKDMLDNMDSTTTIKVVECVPEVITETIKEECDTLDCPVCKPTPCPKCVNCAKCLCETQLSREDESILLNLKISRTSPAHQNGFYQCKREVLVYFGLKPEKFNEGPSTTFYKYLYADHPLDSLICFPDRSDGRKTSFDMNNTIWMIPPEDKDHMIRVYKRDSY